MPSNHERHLPSRPDTRHRLRLVRLLIALLAAVAAIAAMECIVFNLPFWRTLGRARIRTPCITRWVRVSRAGMMAC